MKQTALSFSSEIVRVFYCWRKLNFSRTIHHSSSNISFWMRVFIAYATRRDEYARRPHSRSRQILIIYSQDIVIQDDKNAYPFASRLCLVYCDHYYNVYDDEEVFKEYTHRTYYMHIRVPTEPCMQFACFVFFLPSFLMRSYSRCCTKRARSIIVFLTHRAGGARNTNLY